MNVHSTDQPTWLRKCNTDGPASVPPGTDGSTRMSQEVSLMIKDTLPTSIPPSTMFKNSSSYEYAKGFKPVSSSDREKAPASLDLMDVLQRSEPSVVKSRTGSVLSRGMILKTDHYPSGAC